MQCCRHDAMIGTIRLPMTQPDRINPTQANQQGLAALSRGDHAAAIAAFRAAISADPAAGALHRNLASVYRAMGDDSGELAALNAALEIDQTDFMALLRKAQLLQRTGVEGGALAAWSGVLQMAASIDPLPESLVQPIADGQAYVATCQSRLGAAVDEALGAALAELTLPAARRAQAFVDLAVGRRRQYLNQCAGLLYPFLPADEFFDDGHFPWFDDLAAATGAIRGELLALIADGDDALRPYVRMQKGTPDSKWSPLDHSLDWGACFLWEYGLPNQAVLDRCPQTAAALAAVPSAEIPGRAPSAFFSILKPRTRIPAHTGVSNTRAIIHLPLIVPEGCGFRVGGETRQWLEGRPFAFDDTIEHEAWNDSDELRAVLIFDVWNPHLSVEEQKIIARYYAAADSVGFNI